MRFGTSNIIFMDLKWQELISQWGNNLKFHLSHFDWRCKTIKINNELHSCLDALNNLDLVVSRLTFLSRPAIPSSKYFPLTSFSKLPTPLQILIRLEMCVNALWSTNSRLNTRYFASLLVDNSLRRYWVESSVLKYSLTCGSVFLFCLFLDVFLSAERFARMLEMKPPPSVSFVIAYRQTLDDLS